MLSIVFRKFSFIHEQPKTANVHWRNLPPFPALRLVLSETLYYLYFNIVDMILFQIRQPRCPHIPKDAGCRQGCRIASIISSGGLPALFFYLASAKPSVII